MGELLQDALPEIGADVEAIDEDVNVFTGESLRTAVQRGDWSLFGDS